MNLDEGSMLKFVVVNTKKPPVLYEKAPKSRKM